MNIKSIILMLGCFGSLTVLGEMPAIGETNTVPDVSGSPLPATTSEFWTYAIAVIVPLIVNAMKKLAPKIPSWVLPVSTPFLGVLLGLILKWLGAAEMGWVDMAQAGGLAVLIRESWNQIITKQLNPSTT